MFDVIVIGGGWAGLSAGVNLADAGLSVALLESAPEVGGRARSVLLNLGGHPTRLDAGQHLLTGAYHACLALANQLHAVPLQRRRFSLSDVTGFSLRSGRLPAPFHLLLAVLSGRGLDWSERWALTRFIFALFRAGWLARPSETVSSLLQRFRQPETLVTKLWGPLCLGALNTVLSSACAQTFCWVLRDTLGGSRSDSDFLLPPSSLHDWLGGPAVQWLIDRNAVVSTRTTVQRLLREQHCWRLVTTRGEFETRQIVLAIPPKRTRALVTPLCADTAELLGKFETAAIATLYLAWLVPCDLPPWIMLREQPDCLHAGQWLFDRGHLPLVRNEQRNTCMAEPPPLRVGAVVISGYERYRQAPREALVAGVIGQIQHTLGLPPPVDWQLIVEKTATFLCTPGRPKPVVTALAKSCPGLWLAGDHMVSQYPATLESAVRSGVTAAQHVLQSHASQGPVGNLFY